MKGIKLWPHVTILVILCAALGVVGGVLWSRHDQRVDEAQSLPSAARVERVDGQVALNRSLNNKSSKQFVEVTPNTPVSVGDRLYTRDNSRASLAFTGRNFARLNDHSSLDVLSLSDRRTQLALRDGSAIFNVGELSPGELFEVATPNGAIDLQQPGLYEVGIDNRGSTVVSVLSGLAQVVGLAGTGQISKGEMLTLLGQTAADVALSRLDSGYAGNLVNDYYGYQYPGTYDGRYNSYDAYLNDPYYYDPYNRYGSYQYVADSIPGVYDLDSYGDWQNVDGYGNLWRPRVDANWSPYQQGYWTTDDTYGLTWISNEPWGYAPYHYGRWVYVNNQWFWVPERVNTQPAYSPALVAFIPFTQTNQIGWAPLGPGDPYAVTYYDENWQPHYLAQPPVIEQQIVNLSVPGAVTVVPLQVFDRVIDPRVIKRVDPQMLAQARPVLDPFAVDAIRQAALKTTEARRKIDVPEEVAERIDNTRVITSTAPAPPPFRKDLAETLRVEAVPEKQRKEKLEFKDNRRTETARQSDVANQPGQTGAPAVDRERKQQMEKLTSEAARGNKEARAQMRELERQQREQERTQQTATRQQAAAQQGGAAASAQAENARAAERAQGEKVGQQIRAQREAGRQQVKANEQRAVVQQQKAAQNQANQQAAIQRAQQAAAQRAQQGRGRAQQAQGQPQVIQQARPKQTNEGKQGPPAAKGEGAQPRGQGAGGKGKGRP